MFILPQLSLALLLSSWWLLPYLWYYFYDDYLVLVWWYILIAANDISLVWFSLWSLLLCYIVSLLLLSLWKLSFLRYHSCWCCLSRHIISLLMLAHVSLMMILDVYLVLWRCLDDVDTCIFVNIFNIQRYALLLKKYKPDLFRFPFKIYELILNAIKDKDFKTFVSVQVSLLLWFLFINLLIKLINLDVLLFIYLCTICKY